MFLNQVLRVKDKRLNDNLDNAFANKG